MHNSLALLVIGLGLLAECYIARSMPPSALMIRRARQVQVSEDETDVNGPWERFIVPAPAVVSLLGQLMVISSKVDFSLVEYAPVGGFKYMRHPESYRASLVQVSNDGWDAFMNAHTNMEKIKVYTQRVPSEIRDIMSVLAHGSINIAESYLPDNFNNIRDIGRLCVKLSNETHAKFIDVMSLLGELLEVTSSSQGAYEEKKVEVDTELAVAMAEKQTLEQIGTVLKKQQEDVNQEVSKARDSYNAAMKAIPSSLKAIGLELLGGLAHLLTSTLSPLSTIITARIGHGGSKDPSTQVPTEGGKISLVESLIKTTETMKNTTMNIFEGTIKQDQTNLSDVATLFMMGLTGVESMLGDVGDAGLQVTKLIGRAKSICQQLHSMDGKAASQTEESGIENGFDGLLNDMKKLVVKAKTPTGSSFSPCHDYSGIGGDERYKADTEYAHLKYEQERSDNILKDVTDNYNQMKDLVGKLAKLNMTEINYKQIVELLTEGIKVMGQIRTQWSNLVQFFTLVSVQAEYAMNETFVPFLKQAKDVAGNIGKNDITFLLGLLEDKAKDIDKNALFLTTLSSTYYEVSSKYLIGRLASLSELLSAKDDSERDILLRKLNGDVIQAQDAIMDLSQAKRQKYHQQIEADQQKLEDIMKKLDGPSDQDKLNSGTVMLHEGVGALFKY